MVIWRTELRKEVSGKAEKETPASLALLLKGRRPHWKQEECAFCSPHLTFSLSASGESSWSLGSVHCRAQPHHHRTEGGIGAELMDETLEFIHPPLSMGDARTFEFLSLCCCSLCERNNSSYSSLLSYQKGELKMIN